MTSHEIAVDLHQLLQDHVETYEQLEVLLLFAGRSGEAWTTAEVADAAKLQTPTASEALEDLSRSGVLERTESGGVARFVVCAARARAVDRLGEAYQRDRLGVMNLMTANALDRVRTSALRAFAKAFLLGRERDG